MEENTNTTTKQAIGAEQLREALSILQAYKKGKAHLEQRVVENDQWYKMRHWEQIRKKGAKGYEPEAASAWLFNSIANKHADAMDSYPLPTVLPREEGDRGEAQKLSSILPVILERNDFEQVFSDVWWYKLKTGTGVYGVFWDNRLENGLGDISIRKLDILNLFWEPGISDIQASKHLFLVELSDIADIEQAHPALVGKLAGQTIDVASYIYDDSIDTSQKCVVIDWYYKVADEQGERLHYCKFVGDEVLYASENAGLACWYEHGKYPIVFDSLFPEEGTPAGFGYIDIMKDAQIYIDKLGSAILKSAVMAAKPRFFVKDSASINEDEFADLSRDFVHVAAGQIDDTGIKQIEITPVPATAINVLQMKIEELKETSGNRDFSQGGASGGVTAASAIAALQEAGSKLSRDMNKSGYRAFRAINSICIELMRQFYTEPRCFRITGEAGAEAFARYDNRLLQPQPMDAFGTEKGLRLPLFDLKVTSQKASPFSTLAQNEMAKELYGLGFFSPEMADQALVAMELMDFEGKEMVRQKVAANGTMMQMLMQMQGQMAKMAAIIDGQNGTAVSGMVGGGMDDSGTV